MNKNMPTAIVVITSFLSMFIFSYVYDKLVRVKFNLPIWFNATLFGISMTTIILILLIINFGIYYGLKKLLKKN